MDPRDDDPENEQDDDGGGNVWDGDQEMEETLFPDSVARADVMIFLVDFSSAMFAPTRTADGAETTAFHQAMAVCAQYARAKCLVQQKNCKIGLVFFGTEKSSRTGQFKNVYDQYEGLEEISADLVKEFFSWSVSGSAKSSELIERLGHELAPTSAQSDSFHDGIWCAYEKLSSDKKLQSGLDTQRVWILTNSKGPFARTTQIESRVKDYADARRELLLWSIGSSELGEVSSYWTGLMQTHLKRLYSYTDATATEEDKTTLAVALEGSIVPLSPESSVEDMMKTVRKKQYAKRKLSTLSLILAPGVEIPAALYSLVMPTKRPTKISIDSTSQRPVKSERLTKSVDLQRVLNTSDQIASFQLYGASPAGPGSMPGSACSSGIRSDDQSMSNALNASLIYVHPDDKAKVRRSFVHHQSLEADENEEEVRRSFGKKDAEVVILGMRPAADLEPWMVVRQSLLMRPDENGGSKRAMVALITEMLAQNLIAMVRLVSRQNSEPRLAALIPRPEVLDEAHRCIVPAGFTVSFLPFRDDVRFPRFDNKSPEKLEVKQDSLTLATKLVESFLIPGVDDAAPGKFDARNFQRPDAQKFWSELESIAIERVSEAWTDEKDTLKPNEEFLIFELGDTVQAFNDSYGGKGIIEAAVKPKPAPKRARETGGPVAKRAKTEADGTEKSQVMLLLKQGKSLLTLNVPVLKGYCAANGLAVGGTKAVLIERINEHVARVGLKDDDEDA